MSLCPQPNSVNNFLIDSDRITSDNRQRIYALIGPRSERIWLCACQFSLIPIFGKYGIQIIYMQNYSIIVREKSGNFGQTAKFGQRPCLFHISNIGINNKLTKQTVKILTRRLIGSCHIWIYTVSKCVSEFTRCPKLPDFLP